MPRLDPKPRSLDPNVTMFALDPESLDSTRHYVLVSKADERHGIEWYEYVGYEVETYRDGGPRFLLQKKGDKQRAGVTMERGGHVLMSVEGERFQEILQHGALGAGGLESTNVKMRRILGKDGRGNPDGESFPGSDEFVRGGRRTGEFATLNEMTLE